MVLVVLVGLIVAAAAVIDFGQLYFSYDALKTTTQAAALAGGAAIPNGGGTAAADLYSGQSPKDYNYRSTLNITNVNVSYACISSTTYPAFQLPTCATYSDQGNANAIQVTETATVPTYFAKYFGLANWTISATASASANGASPPPYHIMMLLDSTASMGSGNDKGCTQSNPNGGYSPEQCAQLGVQTFLSGLSPCLATAGQCQASGTSGVVLNPVDEVGLMTFPGLCSATGAGITTSNCPAATTLTNTTANSTYAPVDYACPSSNPPIASYNNDPEYLILPLQSDYRTSDTASALNSNSELVDAVGASNITNNSGTKPSTCNGIKTPGGEGTFYAGAIDAAQAYLQADNTPGIQNIIIFLSDGNAGNGSMGGTVKNGNGTLYATNNQCTQAIASADAAKNAGTWIYSVSYGSEPSGCSTGEGLTPCQTMEQISSSPTGGRFFFSVPSTRAGQDTICGGAVPITELYQVFQNIQQQLSRGRLIPNSVWPSS
jgi:hypothetical protein